MSVTTTTPEETERRPVLVSVRQLGMGAVADAYDAHHESLYAYVATLTRDRGAAEEMVQDAYARLVAVSREGRPPDEPRAWLYAVCTNLAVTRSRRRAIAGRWRHLLAPRDDELTDEAAEDSVLRRERNKEMRVALATLPGEHRAALLLAADGFSGREIAAILGRSEGATRNILWRSRLALRDRLGRGGGR